MSVREVLRTKLGTECVLNTFLLLLIQEGGEKPFRQKE